MSIRFIWDDTYYVGVEALDNQHKHLFNLGNKIQDATPSDAKSYVMELYKYIRIHFDLEEKHMKALDYPEISSHQKMHEALVTDLNRLSKNFDSSELDELIRFLHTWLINHVLKEDKKYFEFSRLASRPT